MRTLRKLRPINAGSMADIAFLLLIFFLVTTTINNDQGLTLQLPPLSDAPPAPVAERNLFKVLINGQNQILAEGELVMDLQSLSGKIKEFILNPSGSQSLAVSPQKAVVSLKTHRGSGFETYIKVLDLLKGVYDEIYGERVGLSPWQFRNLDMSDPDQRLIYHQARQGIPMNISIAETD
jgi:biopolymer transport protein ExbD